MRRKQKVIPVYGSLYMDLNESVEFAEMQIADIIADCPGRVEGIFLVFDIVATPYQLRRGGAHRMGRKILSYIDEHYPNLAARLVGITDNDYLRPARERMLRSSKRIDNVHQFIMFGDEYDVFPDIK
jgi:hypothetical protein